MARILRLDTSPRVKGSHTRELGNHFEQYWLKKHPEDIVIKRDLGTNPVPHLDWPVTKAIYAAEKRELNAKEKKDIALSDELIQEYLDSDILLLVAPMYNLSPPSCFKAWLDHIVRRHYLFDITKDGQLKPLLSKEKYIFMVAAYGIPYQGMPWEHMDHMYVTACDIFELCGIPKENMHIISAQGTEVPGLRPVCKREAKKEMEKLIDSLL